MATSFPARIAPRPAIGVARYLVAFFLPFGVLIRAQAGGQLFLHDFLTPVVLLVLLISPGPKVSLRPLRTFGWLISLWLFGQILTDLIQQSPFEDYSRGWLRIILLGFNVLTLWLLSQGRLALLSTYLAGTGVSMILSPLFSPDEVVQSDPWKFAVGGGAALLAAALSDSSRLRATFGQYLPVLLLSGLALVSLWNNSRSLFAILALSAAYFGVAKLVSERPGLRTRVNPLNFAFMALFGLLASQLLSSAYQSAAASGTLGDVAYRKYLAQSQADVSLLVGGRPELLVSVQAIADSPIIGHGSWAKDPYYVVLLAQRMEEVGLHQDLTYSLQQYGALIPTHSHLLGSWVDAGFLAFPFWAWVLIMSMAALYRSLKVGGSASAVVVLTAFFLFWDVLFSPYGSSARFLRAVQICILIVAVRSFRTAALPAPQQFVVAARPVMQPRFRQPRFRRPPLR